MTVAAFDFRSPPPGDLERQAAAWLEAAASRASASWPETLGFPIELRLGAVETMTFSGGVNRFAADAVAFPLTTADSADGKAILALPRPLLLALLAGLLGEIPEDAPADREPTELEASLNDYLARELFLSHLEIAWTGDNALQLLAGNLESAGRTRRGSSGEMALLASLTVSAKFGQFPVHLLLPRVGRWERLALPARLPRPAITAEPERLAALVREMPVELAVELGQAELTMTDVAHLRAGDLVILRQKVNEPLDGFIGGTKKFRVWPGAIGTRAAVQIHAHADG